MPAEPSGTLPITPEQMRAARELLGCSRDRLAMQSHTTVGFIGRFEDTGEIGTLLWHPKGVDALAAIRAALEQAGVEFRNGGEPGVKLRKAEA